MKPWSWGCPCSEVWATCLWSICSIDVFRCQIFIIKANKCVQLSYSSRICFLITCLIAAFVAASDVLSFYQFAVLPSSSCDSVLFHQTHFCHSGGFSSLSPPHLITPAPLVLPTLMSNSAILTACSLLQFWTDTLTPRGLKHRRVVMPSTGW